MKDGQQSAAPESQPYLVLCWNCRTATRSDSDHCQNCGVPIEEFESPILHGLTRKPLSKPKGGDAAAPSECERLREFYAMADRDRQRLAAILAETALERNDLQGDVEGLRAQLAAKDALLVEARQDMARLDWLERQMTGQKGNLWPTFDPPSMDPMCDWKWFSGDEGPFETLREAIDAAIEKAKESANG